MFRGVYMKIISFKKIREEHPDKFLVLVDYEEKELSLGEVEILGAEYYHVYDDGMDMFNAYRDLKKKGQKVVFCTPDYVDRFVMERRPSMRVLG